MQRISHGGQISQVQQKRTVLCLRIAACSLQSSNIPCSAGRRIGTKFRLVALEHSMCCRAFGVHLLHCLE
eukprot:12933480-Prorocentrum_lima.AAC.1